MGSWRDRRKDDVSLDLWEILAEELETTEPVQILPAAFDVRAEGAVLARAAFDDDPTKLKAWNDSKRAVEQELFEELHQRERSALCFSGGGVRSATFGLGILQGLAALGDNIVPRFDFLSTVSGGGYLGGWFSAWAARTPGKSSAEAVAALSQRANSTLEPEPVQLRHIREYCAFLNPRPGALSADTWMLVSTILRNMILNWTVLIPLLLALLLVPSLYLSLLPVDRFAGNGQLEQITLWIGFVTGVIGACYVLAHLPIFCGPSQDGDDQFVVFALAPLTISAITLTIHWAWYARGTVNYQGWEFAAFGAATHGVGALIALGFIFARSHFKWGPVPPRPAAGRYLLAVLCAVVSGGIAGFIAYLFSALFYQHFAAPGYTLSGDSYRIYAVFAIPIVLGAFTVAAMVMVGLASKFTGDDDREWWSRAGGWMLIVMTGWLVFCASVILAPHWLTGAASQAYAYLGTLTLGGVASWLGFSAKTASGRNPEQQADSRAKSNGGRELTAALAGPVFLLLLVATLAIVNRDILKHLQEWLPLLPGITSETGRTLWLFALGSSAAIFCSFGINVNRFSLHAMYRMRLIRTYLGASRPNRSNTVNRFIDMDDADNISMAQLSPTRPLHIVNIALNLVGGKNLAWQQRKAESFTASRLRTGSLRVGYQNTEKYGGKSDGKQKGLTLGAAISISGAAASPNMGYHSSPLLSFVMTLFNARLGWWLANPGRAGKGSWTQDGPTIAFMPIVDEALGRTNDESQWVYLSDGGHFENLGLYEMVLRRCHWIVVVDGSEDGSYTFEDLGNACRKIRIDLGIPVTFTESPGMRSTRNPRNCYCALGTIHYTQVDATPFAKDGQILYIKACLNESEPLDILNYASTNRDFPQQGTEQLWFDESQFESYRKLGQHIADTVFKTSTDVPDLFAKAKEYLRKSAKVKSPVLSNQTLN